GMRLLDEAMAILDKAGERCFEAELHRLKGVMLIDESNDDVSVSSDAAEDCLQSAIEVARAQGARSLELRAVTSLARRWRRVGRVAEARQALSEIYGWFTEGFDTADLREAKALLEALASDQTDR
ncbi:hypothetical protein NX905_29130, partial [Burkholderia thailandensis]|nr:hypothetical protein [Burkholderia thailandensis]